MRKLTGLLASLALAGALAQSSAFAADPDHIKVGVLLPLTGTFAAVAETQKQGAQLAVDVINKRGGLEDAVGQGHGRGGGRRRRGQARRRRAALSLHGLRRRARRRRPDLGAARLRAQRHRVEGPAAVLPGLRDVEGRIPQGQDRQLDLRGRVQPVDGRLHGGPVRHQVARQEAHLLPRALRQLGLGHARRRQGGGRAIRRRGRSATTRCRSAPATSPPSCRRCAPPSPTCSSPRSSAPTRSRCSSRCSRWASATR